MFISTRAYDEEAWDVGQRYGQPSEAYILDSMASQNDKYIRGKLLGKGSFGSAILVTSKVDGKQHVIKEIDVSRMPRAERESAELEAKVGSCSRPATVICYSS